MKNRPSYHGQFSHVVLSPAAKIKKLWHNYAKEDSSLYQYLVSPFETNPPTPLCLTVYHILFIFIMFRLFTEVMWCSNGNLLHYHLIYIFRHSSPKHSLDMFVNISTQFGSLHWFIMSLVKFKWFGRKNTSFKAFFFPFNTQGRQLPGHERREPQDDKSPSGFNMWSVLTPWASSLTQCALIWL